MGGRSWGEATSGCRTWSPCAAPSLPGQCPHASASPEPPAASSLSPGTFMRGLWVTPSRCWVPMSIPKGCMLLPGRVASCKPPSPKALAARPGATCSHRVSPHKCSDTILWHPPVLSPAPIYSADPTFWAGLSHAPPVAAAFRAGWAPGQDLASEGMKLGARVLPTGTRVWGAPRHHTGRGQVGTSHPSPGPAGAVGLVSWHPLTAGMWELGSKGLGHAAGVSARVNASQYLPGFPHSHGRVEVGAGGAGFVLVPPVLILGSHWTWPWACADAAGRRSPPAAEAPPAQGWAMSRLLLHPFPLSSPVPRPAALCAHTRCWPLGTWLPVGVSVPGDTHCGVGKGEGRRAAILVRAARCGQAVLEKCSGSPTGKPGILWV